MLITLQNIDNQNAIIQLNTIKNMDKLHQKAPFFVLFQHLSIISTTHYSNHHLFIIYKKDKKNKEDNK